MGYNALNQYKQNTVLSATPEELTLMLLDGAIKFINIGKYSIGKNDISKAHEALLRAQDIVWELNASLNMDYEISNNLKSIYDFIIERLIDGNVSKEIKPLDEALELLQELRDTWKEAMKSVKKARYANK